MDRTRVLENDPKARVAELLARFAIERNLTLPPFVEDGTGVDRASRAGPVRVSETRTSRNSIVAAGGRDRSPDREVVA